jgi:hypothetical protein
MLNLHGSRRCLLLCRVLVERGGTDTMQFDETRYREDFLKQHRGARGAPGDLLTRYAIALPATDGDVAAQVRAVRAYWNKIYNGKTGFAQVAKLCRAEDERLKAEHGAKMETSAWWRARQSDTQRAAVGAIAVMGDDLRRRFGTLGVVSAGMLGQFAAKLSLSAAQADQAAERAGLTVIRGVSLPAAEPVGNFSPLVKAMAECAVASVPELVHPGAGEFRLVERYECLADPRKRLDAVAVEVQRAAAEKRGISATENARRRALTILNQAVRSGVDLRDIALYHMVAIARGSAGVSIDLAAAELRASGLEARDAAIVAVLVAEQGGGPGGMAAVPELLAEGRLREARATAMALPADGGAREDAMQQINAAQAQLDQLIAAARAALAAPDEARAEALLKDAARISAEDAATELAAVPLPPPAGLRASLESGTVRLFWQPAPGHEPDTVYVVRRTTQPRPPAAPTEGEPVHRDHGDTCADPRAPVARPVRYAVFALGEGRPGSRPATVTVTPLPPVAGLRAEVGASTVSLSWSAHPDAEVRVTRAVPGAAPAPLPVTGGSCQVAGLAEGKPQTFQVTAVYRGPDGTELRSVPQVVSATPRAQARPVTTLRARPVAADGGIRVRVSWTPVDAADVKIVRAEREPTIPFGRTVSFDEMTAVGRELTGTPITAPGKAGFETPLPPGVHRLVPFSVGGTGIVMGRAATVAVTDPVRHLSVTAFADYATLSWEWPENSQIAEVHWRLDGEEDVRQVDAGQYLSGGGVRVPLGRGPCHVEVRAVITVAGKSFASPPVSAEIAHVVETPIRYQVSSTGPSLGPLGGRKKKVVFTADEPCSGVQVVMVARQGPVLPVRPSDGVAIFDTVLTLRPGVAEELRATVPGFIKKPFWVRCFIVAGQARLVDPPVTSLKEA